MKAMLKYVLFALSIVFTGACTYQFPEEQEFTENDLGEINTDKIIAVGDGFLGGAMDGALYTNGQNNSVASIIVSQLRKIKETEFNKAEINTENGYNFYESTGDKTYGKWIYRFLSPGAEEPVRRLTDGEPVSAFQGNKNDLHDLTIPMFKIKNLNEKIPNEINPYISRIYEPDTDIFSQITGKSPTLVLLWLGINDYLRYAINGATNEEMLVQLSEFQENFQTLIHQLLQYSDAKIVMGNFIPIIDLPYFYVYQYNYIRLPNAERAAAQARYSNYNNGVANYNVGKPMNEWRQMISFEDNGSTLYPQAIVVDDPQMTPAFYPDGTLMENFRQLNKNEMALLSITPQMIQDGYGSIIPLPDKYYLSEKQIEKINERINAFNSTISLMVQNNQDRMVLADVKSEIAGITPTGRMDSWGFRESEDVIYANGVPVEARLEQYSIFSLDGIHLNQRGNAWAANIFLNAVNLGFRASVPLADINSFPGNIYTFQFSD
jgi:hypothetical protein